MPARSEPAPVVTLPRRYLDARQALALLGRQTDRPYALAARTVRGLVGPFDLGQQLAATDLLGRVADAAGLELDTSRPVALLQPPAPPELDTLRSRLGSEDPATRRQAAFDLGESLRVEAVEPLMQAISDDDRSVARSALLALGALEGDFAHSDWPGRASLFELPDVDVDRETLLWLIEEGAVDGGLEWKAATSILGRAREPELPRCIWWKIWRREPGCIAPAVWAMGRCGDPDLGNPISQILKGAGTNVDEDRYLAGAALGRLGAVDRLARCAPADGGFGLDVRLAATYGLGFAAESADAVELLASLLADPDARVRELAALSLGRLDTEETAACLARTLADAG
ncbi:MAG: HEAT repeat domain-containing protein, partial [Planctomycetota bacterium]